MPASSFHPDYQVTRLGRILFDQQLWCLGCDAREARHCLAGAGMEPRKRPPGTGGSARYAGPLPPAGHLSLWGFGAVARVPGEGAIFLRRYGFSPLHALDFDPVPEIWSLKALPRFRPVADADAWEHAQVLLGHLAAWFADYERHVNRLQGAAYRERCLRGWTGRKRVPVGGMAGNWDWLAGRCQAMEEAVA